MREIYNEDLSPETPEAKQDFFHCLAACGRNPNVFNFYNLIPSRSAYVSTLHVLGVVFACLVNVYLLML